MSKLFRAVSMEDYLIAKRLSEDMARIAAAFTDEHGLSLKQLGRRTVFVGSDKAIRHGDPEHAEIWAKHEAALVLDTARLVDAMNGVKFSAWCAAVRIVGVRQGVRILLRSGDTDPHDKQAGEI
jgi:hypothetical protein